MLGISDKTNTVSLVVITPPTTGDRADTSSSSLVFSCAVVEKPSTSRLFPSLCVATSFTKKDSTFISFYLVNLVVQRNQLFLYEVETVGPK